MKLLTWGFSLYPLLAHMFLFVLPRAALTTYSGRVFMVLQDQPSFYLPGQYPFLYCITCCCAMFISFSLHLFFRLAFHLASRKQLAPPVTFPYQVTWSWCSKITPRYAECFMGTWSVSAVWWLPHLQ